MRDLKKQKIYSEINFDIPVGSNGDCFDRYLVRIEEMRQSLKIIEQSLSLLSEGPIKSNDLQFFKDR